jgi:GNAT superfamily N-acetyltransferase
VAPVDDWLAAKALQQQDKCLSVTKALLAFDGAVAGYYTLAMGQVACGDLPLDVARGLPRRELPVVTLAWLGVDANHQRRGLGSRLVGQAFHDCWEVRRTLGFVAIVLDSIDEETKAFYVRWGFRDLFGHRFRMFLTAHELDAIIAGQ